MTQIEKGPIFIGGPDRCGKTTMRAFVASHPNIAIPAVGSNMWTYFYGQYGDLADDDNFERCLDDMLHYKHVAFLQPDPERIRRDFRHGQRSYARLFSLFLIHFAEREGKPRWGAQTGLIERYASNILDAYPGARIIQMIRDPRDRYEASLALWPKGKLRAGGAAARWRYSVDLADRNVARYPDQALNVRYETLVSEPELTLRRVCDFLGESYDPDMLAMAGAQKFRDKMRADRDVPAGQSPLTTDYIGRYRGRIPKAEIAFIQAHAGRQMKAHQYSMDKIQFSTREKLHFYLVENPVNLVKMWGWLAVEKVQHHFPRLAGRTPGKRMIVDPNYRELRQAAAKSS
jgi:hypothetical protein